MGKIPRRAATARALGKLHRAAMRCWDLAPLSPVLIEPLERRQMLSASAVPVRRNLGKLDTNLVSAYKQYTAAKSTEGAAAAIAAVSTTSSVLNVIDGAVQLQTYANVGDAKLLQKALGKLGGQNIQANGREIDVSLLIAELGKLASLASLRFAEATSYTVNSGVVTSQGDISVNGPTARNTYGVTGAGVTVGILSDSFNNNSSSAVTDHYSNDVASGDLPSGVTILADNIPGTDEGRAMAQVIYDTAPGVNFAFATGEGGYVSAAKYLAGLATAGAKVIVDDLTYPTEPFFVDSVLSQEVTALTNAGVVYISSAGNYGENSYASNWSNGTSYTSSTAFGATTALPFYPGTSFNFNPTGGVNDKQGFNLSSGSSVKISMQWDQPYFSVSGSPGCANQVDIYVLNSAGTQILGESSNLTLGADPTQYFSYTNTSGSAANYKLMIVSETGYAVPGKIKYIEFDGQATNWTYTTNSSTIFGHANAAGAETVGAASYANTPAYGVNPPVLESYSSEGGTPILFTTAGSAEAAVIRQEPAIVGPDNVFTTFYGTKVGNNTYPTFSGTSAAAAGVAGVAALLVQKNPGLTPAAIDTILNSTAINIGTAPNNLAGYGLVQAIPALAQTVGNLTGTIFNDYNTNGIQNSGEPGVGGVTVYIDANNSGSLQPGDAYTTTAANGTYAFYNYPSGTAIVRVIPPTGYVVSSMPPYKAVPIAGANTSSGVNLGLFPDAYTFTANGTNVTLQVDATTPANIDILVNNVLTYTAPISILPALGFNFANSSSSTLTINYANGDPIPGGGVTESATGSAANDTLIMNGTSAGDTVNVNYQTTTFDNSTVLLNNITSEIINGNGGNDNFLISTAQPSNQTLVFNGGIGNDTLTVDDVLPNNGVGTTFNAGTNSADQNVLNVNAGIFTFTGNPAAQSANLTVNLGSTQGVDSNDNPITEYGDVVFAAGALGSGINQRSIAALNIGPFSLATLAPPASHNDRSVLIVGTLNISSGSPLITGGTLDLNANDAIITSASLANIEPSLASGYNGGLWSGTGIQSSAAATDTTYLTAIGSLQNNGNFATFDGVGNIAGAVLLKYTYYGDANLDGKVDGTDYTRIDNGFTLGLTGWANGDFNYDGAVDGSDYALIDNSFNTQGSPLT